MVKAATKERARELRRAGGSLREIGKVVGVSHVTVREWTLGEPVGGPASGGRTLLTAWWDCERERRRTHGRCSTGSFQRGLDVRMTDRSRRRWSSGF